MTNIQLISVIQSLGLPYRQAINEFAHSPSGGWVHLSIDPVGTVPRREVLIAEGTRDNPIYRRA